jgi:hypothetical protein
MQTVDPQVGHFRPHLRHRQGSRQDKSDKDGLHNPLLDRPHAANVYVPVNAAVNAAVDAGTACDQHHLAADLSLSMGISRHERSIFLNLYR